MKANRADLKNEILVSVFVGENGVYKQGHGLECLF